jgi:hypothetical protein
MGDIDTGMLEPNSCAYIASYVTKKLTSDDDARLSGRHPEFARMSNRPGIGKDAMHEVASAILTAETELVSSLRHGAKTKPLGRYLRNQLSEMIGDDQEKRKEVEQAIREMEMLPLRQEARKSKEAPTLKTQILQANEGRRRSALARMKIFSQKGKL